ncbi:MAG TPA: hypothetical protein VIT91_13285 [Chthoniobacterales bacterium]
MKKSIQLVLALMMLTLPSVATVDDAISAAMEAADPYVKEGYIIREDQWGGDLAEGDKQAIQHTLFKGNDYWFFVASDTLKARLSVHVYDSAGRLVDQESWQRGPYSATRLRPKATGTYYLIVAIERSPQERTHWALVYGFK